MITALCLALAAMMTFAPAPGDFLTAEMILVEAAQDGALGRSVSVNDPGQCRRFQVNSFAEASAAYALAGQPDAVLYLPVEHAPKEDTGRPVGMAWDMAGEAGNAFVEAARFDYDPALTLRENREAARAFLSDIRAGDLMQLLARYSSGGRGTHTILLSQPYDPRDPMLYWMDSNFSNTIVDGERYAYVRARQAWPLEEVVDWLTKDENNGATLYRLREDVVRRDSLPGR